MSHDLRGFLFHYLASGNTILSGTQINPIDGLELIIMAEKTMDKATMLKEIKDLEILNISPSGYLSKEIVSDAINAVKSANLDLDKIAAEVAADLGE